MKTEKIKTTCCASGCNKTADNLVGTPRALCGRHYNLIYSKYRRIYGAKGDARLSRNNEQTFLRMKRLVEEKEQRTKPKANQLPFEMIVYSKPALSTDDVETEDEN